MNTKTMKRQLEGTVVSTKMAKTVVVRVDRIRKHPKYHKQYASSSRYKAHDPKNECVEGDHAVIQACRPISKDKRWRVISVTHQQK